LQLIRVEKLRPRALSARGAAREMQDIDVVAAIVAAGGAAGAAYFALIVVGSVSIALVWSVVIAGVGTGAAGALLLVAMLRGGMLQRARRGARPPPPDPDADALGAPTIAVFALLCWGGATAVLVAWGLAATPSWTEVTVAYAASSYGDVAALCTGALFLSVVLNTLVMYAHGRVAALVNALYGTTDVEADEATPIVSHTVRHRKREASPPRAPTARRASHQLPTYTSHARY
jgi:hypothetical protein